MNPTKNRGDFRCFGRVSSSYPTGVKVFLHHAYVTITEFRLIPLCPLEFLFLKTINLFGFPIFWLWTYLIKDIPKHLLGSKLYILYCILAIEGWGYDAISWRSILLVDESGESTENDRLASHWQTLLRYIMLNGISTHVSGDRHELHRSL